jgi:thiamine-monophosphate kinase
MKPGRRLADLGEDAVVAAITRKLRVGADVRHGAGDDCAVVGGPRDRIWRLLKTDVVVEGVHFLAAAEADRVGWKALCRAISDIAAMGGTPEHALVTVALAAETPMAWLENLYRGLRRAADRFGVSIVGGETSRSPGPAFINVALTGCVERKNCVLRSGGRAGDALYVTGRLGGSLRGKHLDFTPRLAEATWLVTHHLPHAMMDLSDGLAADLPRLASASQCGFELDDARIPRTPGSTTAEALSDGEDFELLFAVAPNTVDKLQRAWKRKFPRLPLTRIGSLTAKTRRTPALPNRIHGHDHFA